jgi:hypothetical protein
MLSDALARSKRNTALCRAMIRAAKLLPLSGQRGRGKDPPLPRPGRKAELGNLAEEISYIVKAKVRFGATICLKCIAK